MFAGLQVLLAFAFRKELFQSSNAMVGQEELLIRWLVGWLTGQWTFFFVLVFVLFL